MTFNVFRGIVGGRVKTINKRMSVIAIAGIVSFWAAGCDLLAAKPPFVYGDAVIRIGEVGGYQERIGLTFSLHNKTDAAINRIQVTFKLYDEQGLAIPEFGQNEINNYLDCEFAAGSDQTFITSLDEFFYFMPSGNYVAEDFHIPYVSFSDGTVWRDSYDLYRRPGKILSEVIQ